ncbi:MAG: ribosome small subunit-dependent GTPase A [Ignavibacteria bacterium]|nr:ribosome small subunit-dependent GTPase A [Ignavibacteria bacterium]MBK6417785.1 ribosome small subunit-dependent GTPase A [Ignavibacteria bacterium]MBK7185578.1 ribosome small subunit-dependent GTPase A [Ignavibacteria bacterium]MBK7411291.1 ribosome small subunit-dependent GTPase A [Ignavibacteria bacterium]
MSQRKPLQPAVSDEEGIGYQARTRERAKRAERTKTRIKQGKVIDHKGLRGIVATPIGPNWIVAVDHEFWICGVSGVVDVPHTSTMIVVGDVVWIEPEQDRTELGDLSANIVKVEPRITVLSRKAAGKAQKEQVLVANVEQLGIVMSATLPDYNKRLIDRYLIAADKGDLEPFIVINKMDLIDPQYYPDFEDDLHVYIEQLALPVIFLSAKSGTGMQQLQDILAGRSTLLTGPSGVGKSSMINRFTDARQRVGAISEKYEKGRHTTTASLVIPLPGGGIVVDSPGIREFGIFELEAGELPFYFEEFTPYAAHCKFAPCSHTHEPNCAVKAAVKAGEIDEERYVSYLNLKETL